MAQHGTSICRACETGSGVNDICTTTTQRARKESLQRETGSIHPYGGDGRAGKLAEPYLPHSDSLDWQGHFQVEGRHCGGRRSHFPREKNLANS